VSPWLQLTGFSLWVDDFNAFHGMLPAFSRQSGKFCTLSGAQRTPKLQKTTYLLVPDIQINTTMQKTIQLYKEGEGVPLICRYI